MPVDPRYPQTINHNKMAQLPFTATGVAQKQAELYALSDANLLIQARLITTDIAGWLDTNFVLSDLQKAWIAQAPPMVQFNWGAAVAAVVSARRPITMATPPPTYPPARRTKKIRFELPACFLSWFPPVSGPGQIESNLLLAINWELVD